MLKPISIAAILVVAGFVILTNPFKLSIFCSEIIIKTVDFDTEQPVEGAAVYLFLKDGTNRMQVDDITNSLGRATFVSARSSGNIEVYIEKEGYETVSSLSIGCGLSTFTIRKLSTSGSAQIRVFGSQGLTFLEGELFRLPLSFQNTGGISREFRVRILDKNGNTAPSGNFNLKNDRLYNLTSGSYNTDVYAVLMGPDTTLLTAQVSHMEGGGEIIDYRRTLVVGIGAKFIAQKYGFFKIVNGEELAYNGGPQGEAFEYVFEATANPDLKLFLSILDTSYNSIFQSLSIPEIQPGVYKLRVPFKMSQSIAQGSISFGYINRFTQDFIAVKRSTSYSLGITSFEGSADIRNLIITKYAKSGDAVKALMILENRGGTDDMFIQIKSQRAPNGILDRADVKLIYLQNKSMLLQTTMPSYDFPLLIEAGHDENGIEKVDIFKEITVKLLKGPCNSEWACSGFGGCANGIKTRACIDVNSCSTNEGKPAESIPCEAEPPPIPTPSSSPPPSSGVSSLYLIIAFAASILIVALIVIVKVY